MIYCIRPSLLNDGRPQGYSIIASSISSSLILGSGFSIHSDCSMLWRFRFRTHRRRGIRRRTGLRPFGWSPLALLIALSFVGAFCSYRRRATGASQHWQRSCAFSTGVNQARSCVRAFIRLRITLATDRARSLSSSFVRSLSGSRTACTLRSSQGTGDLYGRLLSPVICFRVASREASADMAAQSWPFRS
jgi:hypothetical protein